MNARRWWLPSFGTVIWLALFLALTCSQWRVPLVSADGDPAYHWAHGKWMLSHGSILRTDVFTHTRAGTPLVEMWWLSEIAMAVVGNIWGWFGLVWLSAIVIATTMWLLYRQIVREAVTPVIAVGAVCLAASVCATHWLARPHVATHLLFVVVGGWLWKFESGKLTSRQLWWLVLPVMVLWANLHSLFFTGLILIGLYAIGNIRRPRLALTFASLALVCLAATLLNPNGWQLHRHLANVLRDPFLLRFAQECAPVNLMDKSNAGLWLLLLALAPVLVWARRRLSLSEWLVLSVWLILGLGARRNLPLFALAAAPIVARHANAWLAGRAWFRRFALRLELVEQQAGGAVWIGIAVAGLAIARPVTELPVDKYPIEAVRYLRRNPGAVNGEMFNQFDWGGYLMLSLPERRVFVYSRLEDASLAREFNIVDDARPGWQEILNRYHVGWTILPRTHRLNTILAQQTDWQVIHRDDVTIVYGRRTP